MWASKLGDGLGSAGKIRVGAKVLPFDAGPKPAGSGSMGRPEPRDEGGGRRTTDAGPVGSIGDAR